MGETIIELDVGWTWGALDFLPSMQRGDARIALDRFSSLENLGQDWRRLTKDLKPPDFYGHQRLPGLPSLFRPNSFQNAISEAKRPGSTLRQSLMPYAARFADLMSPNVLLQCYALSVFSSVAWDASLGP